MQILSILSHSLYSLSFPIGNHWGFWCSPVFPRGVRGEVARLLRCDDIQSDNTALASMPLSPSLPPCFPMSRPLHLLNRVIGLIDRILTAGLSNFDNPCPEDSLVVHRNNAANLSLAVHDPILLFLRVDQKHRLIRGMHDVQLHIRMTSPNFLDTVPHFNRYRHKNHLLPVVLFRSSSPT